MYALAFDLVVAKAEQHHPVGATRAYHDIRDLLTEKFGFEWTQGSLYILRIEDMSILFRAIQAFDAALLVSAIGPRHSRVPCRTVVRLHGHRQRHRDERRW